MTSPKSQTTTTNTTATSTTTSTSRPATTVDLSAKPYAEMASSLPHPPEPDTLAATNDAPPVQDKLTIPGSHISSDTLPWNGEELHWREWRSKYSTIAALYVLAARHYQDNHDDRQAVHVMFSPPQTDIESVSDALQWRKRVTDIAQENGIRGGMTAFHGFRTHPSVVTELKSYIHETDLDGTVSDVLQWEWIRRGGWRNYVRWGPHFHIVGLASDIEAIDSYNGEGVLQRLRVFGQYDRQDTSMETVAEHRSVAKDIVDHVTFAESDPAPPFSWFGELEGDAWWSAEQLATDTTINNIREKLINGPSNPNAVTDGDPQQSEHSSVASNSETPRDNDLLTIGGEINILDANITFNPGPGGDSKLIVSVDQSISRKLAQPIEDDNTNSEILAETSDGLFFGWKQTAPADQNDASVTAEHETVIRESDGAIDCLPLRGERVVELQNEREENSVLPVMYKGAYPQVIATRVEFVEEIISEYVTGDFGSSNSVSLA